MSVRLVSGGIDEFYAALGYLLQNGYVLVSSPLPPNVPLIRSPVRSVIVSHSTEQALSQHKYDVEGLAFLEKAKERTAVLGSNTEKHLLHDLEFIDRDHILRAIRQLQELQELIGLENAEVSAKSGLAKQDMPFILIK